MLRIFCITLLWFVSKGIVAQEVPKTSSKNSLDAKTGGEVVVKSSTPKIGNDYATGLPQITITPQQKGEQSTNTESDNLDRAVAPKGK
ncbi:MAG: hypothetical protein U0T32_13360 [Chitinophagales bacterium]